MKGGERKRPGGRKPKLPAHRKRKVDTIGILPSEWDELDEIGSSRGKAVSKLLKAKRDVTISL